MDIGICFSCHHSLISGNFVPIALVHKETLFSWVIPPRHESQRLVFSFCLFYSSCFGYFGLDYDLDLIKQCNECKHLKNEDVCPYKSPFFATEPVILLSLPLSSGVSFWGGGE
jgi:hypothetical protein